MIFGRLKTEENRFWKGKQERLTAQSFLCGSKAVRGFVRHVGGVRYPHNSCTIGSWRICMPGFRPTKIKQKNRARISLSDRFKK